MARRATGGLLHRDGRLHVRLTVDTGRRTLYALPAGMLEADAAERVEAVAVLVAKMRKAAVDVETVERVARRAVEADEQSKLEELGALVDRLVRGELRRASAPVQTVTFEDVATDWASGKLAKKYPDHVKAKRSASSDRSRLECHVLPIVGAVPIAKFSLDDAMRVLGSLPEDMSASTRRQVAILVKSVLRLAVFPLRLRSSSPLPEGWLPRVPKGSQRQQEILRPEEADRLLGCTTVALEVRVLVGFAAREGMRRSELERVSWEHVDLDHGIVRLDANKTDAAREWALRDDTTKALRRWHATRGKPRKGVVFAVSLRNEELREHLLAAGVDRQQVHEGSASSSPAGMHSLRSLFVTEALARGMPEVWVMERTGHESSAMVALYNRKAKAWRTAHVAPLGDMAQAVTWNETDPQVDSKGIVNVSRNRLSARNNLVGHEGLEPSANGLRVPLPASQSSFLGGFAHPEGALEPAGEPSDPFGAPLWQRAEDALDAIGLARLAARLDRLR